MPREGWFRWLGPFMLATLFGGYNLVGFESVANLAEETEEPHRVVPRGMLRAVIGSTVLGFVFLMTLAVTVGDIKATTASPAPSRSSSRTCSAARSCGSSSRSSACRSSAAA